MKRLRNCVILFMLISMLFCSGCTSSEKNNDTIETLSAEQSSFSKTSSQVSKMVKLPFSYSEISLKHYSEVEAILKELGFKNITRKTLDMDKSSVEFSDGCVIAVYINGNYKFKSGDEFSLDAPIVINHIQDTRIAISQSSSALQKSGFQNAVKVLRSSGFSNIKTVETAVEKSDYDDIIVISINGKTSFKQFELFESDAPVVIYHKVIKPYEQEQVSSTAQGEEFVWVPTNSGKKYHSKPACSNMQNPKQVTLDWAKNSGFTACKRCT